MNSQHTMKIYINGIMREISAGMSVAELVDLLGLAGKRIAVELNQDLVPRSRFPNQRLADNDRIEIIHAVGGG